MNNNLNNNNNNDNDNKIKLVREIADKIGNGWIHIKKTSAKCVYSLETGGSGIGSGEFQILINCSNSDVNVRVETSFFLDDHNESEFRFANVSKVTEEEWKYSSILLW